MFAQIYECSKCGDVWRVYSEDLVDMNGEPYSEIHCSECHGTFLKEKVNGGHRRLHALTDDEIEAETFVVRFDDLYTDDF